LTRPSISSPDLGQFGEYPEVFRWFLFFFPLYPNLLSGRPAEIALPRRSFFSLLCSVEINLKFGFFFLFSTKLFSLLCGLFLQSQNWPFPRGCVPCPGAPSPAFPDWGFYVAAGQPLAEVLFFFPFLAPLFLFHFEWGERRPFSDSGRPVRFFLFYIERRCRCPPEFCFWLRSVLLLIFARSSFRGPYRSQRFGIFFSGTFPLPPIFFFPMGEDDPVPSKMIFRRNRKRHEPPFFGSSFVPTPRPGR